MIFFAIFAIVVLISVLWIYLISFNFFLQDFNFFADKFLQSYYIWESNNKLNEKYFYDNKTYFQDCLDENIEKCKSWWIYWFIPPNKTIDLWFYQNIYASWFNILLTGNNINTILHINNFTNDWNDKYLIQDKKFMFTGDIINQNLNLKLENKEDERIQFIFNLTWWNLLKKHKISQNLTWWFDIQVNQNLFIWNRKFFDKNIEYQNSFYIPPPQAYNLTWISNCSPSWTWIDLQRNRSWANIDWIDEIKYEYSIFSWNNLTWDNLLYTWNYLTWVDLWTWINLYTWSILYYTGSIFSSWTIYDGWEYSFWIEKYICVDDNCEQDKKTYWTVYKTGILLDCN